MKEKFSKDTNPEKTHTEIMKIKNSKCQIKTSVEILSSRLD
jgi:hypothetical protein